MDLQVFEHYKLGIDHLDRQHYDLLGHLADISRAKTKDEACHLIDNLVVDLDAHFITEVRFMESINYPYIAHHIETHKKLDKTFENLREKIVYDTVFDASWVAKDTMRILLNHIDHEDMQYAQYYKKMPKNENI